MQTTSQLPDRLILGLILLVFGVILFLTIVPGVFIADENNYLAMVISVRHGRLSVPGTEHLTPSKELTFFDPEASHRDIQSTPVISLVDPLYAFIALPFSYGGWRGLVLLNILSFLVSVYLVFRYVEQLTQQRVIPWIAAALLAIGGYCIEYAQGMWPQMLSVALSLGTVYLAFESRKKGSIGLAFAAGALIGVATGVREQNIFFAGCVGLGILLFAAKRFRAATAFAAGVVLFLFVIAVINHQRFGEWHPFPKVSNYSQQVGATTRDISYSEPLRVFWAKVVDYPSYGSNTALIRSGNYQWDEASKTVLMNGIVKKSWVQSSPWIGLAIILFFAAWFFRRPKLTEAMREVRILGLIVVPTLFMFSAAGFDRTDGLSFNQRYFLELLPLCAIALALYLDQSKAESFHVGLGLLAGIMVVAAILLLPSSTLRHVGERYVPLLLALAFIVAWFLKKKHRAISLLLGMCIGWAFFYQLESDLVGSRFRRQINASRYAYLENLIPDHSALFTYSGYKDAAGPLQLDRDVVVLDVMADGGQSALQLEEELAKQGRQVFILENEMPKAILDGLVSGRKLHTYSNGTLSVTRVFFQELNRVSN